jgi:hypothetical protein
VSLYLQSAYEEKIPARNAIYAHAQDFAASDELLLAILKAFIPQPLNKQQTIGFHVTVPEWAEVLSCQGRGVVELSK